MERVGNNKKKDPLRAYDKRGEEEKGNCKLCEIREVFCAAAGDALWDLLPVPRSLARVCPWLCCTGQQTARERALSAWEPSLITHIMRKD